MFRRTMIVLLCLLPMAGNGLSQTVEAKPEPKVEAKSTKHPLDPLTEDEIKLASKTLKDDKKATKKAIYASISLSEPKKADVLVYKLGDPFERRAKVVFYESDTNETIEAIVNLGTKVVESRKVVGKQGPWNGDEDRIAERLLRTDPKWQAAVRKRGLDPLDVSIGAMPNRGYVDVKADGSRYVLATSFYGDRAEHAELADLQALINVSKRKVEWIRDGGGKVTRVDNENSATNPENMLPIRTAPKPLKITQPEGQTFTMSGNEVRWQNWRFRIGTDPRIGLVLYTVGYEEADKVRSVLYRASLSELFVPYGDPNYLMTHWFDAGEFGMETSFSSSFVPMNDAPDYAKFLDVIVNDDRGKAHSVPGAIAVYERDGGVLWRHGGEARRSRELVVAAVHQAGNYDYCFQWIFHQDGTLEQDTILSGYMETRTVERIKDLDTAHTSGSESVGLLVSPNTEATNHQHYFSWRLDMDVDGPVQNQLFEMNVASAPPGKNTLQNGMVMTETMLRTEKSAQRNVDMASHRCWKIVNPAIRNKFKQPSAYMLIPGETAVPYSLQDSFLRRESRFTEHQLWATPYNPDQMFAAGDWVYDGAPDDGLAKWTAGNRNIDFDDVVLYYTAGVTHIPRIEDWPIMSAHHAGFKLVPSGFFSSNPAMGVPKVKG